MSHTTTEKLIEDLHAVVRDAEELLRANAGVAGEHIAQARERAEASLQAAREQLAGLAASARQKASDAATCTGDHLHQNPWIAIGAAAAAGLLAGLLVARRPGRSE
jgi:ElaB/YqjD/DUF883 family membrane-anchored ribosome-binding protein